MVKICLREIQDKTPTKINPIIASRGIPKKIMYNYVMPYHFPSTTPNNLFSYLIFEMKFRGGGKYE